ncbi:hypothetical protein ACS0TY_024142 [Phlomoides rotata]
MSSVLTFAEKCKNILASNWQGNLNTIKADAKEDAVISAVVERVAGIIEEQIRNEVSLVRGVEKEVLSLYNELKRIGNVLDDAEKRGYKENSVKDWSKRLEDVSYEMDDVLDEWTSQT